LGSLVIAVDKFTAVKMYDKYSILEGGKKAAPGVIRRHTTRLKRCG